MSQEAPIGAEFFEAVERVRVIHSNCRTLLRGHHPRAGMDLLDSLSLHQETAFERLCRCISPAHIRIAAVSHVPSFAARI